jgi:hypothetical protein
VYGNIAISIYAVLPGGSTHARGPSPSQPDASQVSQLQPFSLVTERTRVHVYQHQQPQQVPDISNSTNSSATAPAVIAAVATNTSSVTSRRLDETSIERTEEEGGRSPRSSELRRRRGSVRVWTPPFFLRADCTKRPNAMDKKQQD